MDRVRSTFAIDGFTAAEASEGIPALRAELANLARLIRKQGVGFLTSEVHWDDNNQQVVVMIETQDLGSRTADAHYDLVWDNIIACINFSGNAIRFNRI